MKTGCIYKITNTANQKIYIGKTVQRPDRRWYFHKYMARKAGTNALYNAIRKYGESAFTFEVVEANVAVAELDDKERAYIVAFNSCALDLTGNGYNLTRGGDGGCSELSITQQRQRVADGKHHFQGDAGRLLQTNRMADGSHNFTPENRKLYQANAKRDLVAVAVKTSQQMKARVESGTHPWQGGSHIRKLVESGQHSSCKIHTCPHCGHTGKGGGMSRWHFNNCKMKGK